MARHTDSDHLLELMWIASEAIFSFLDKLKS